MSFKVHYGLGETSWIFVLWYIIASVLALKHSSMENLIKPVNLVKYFSLVYFVAQAIAAHHDYKTGQEL